VMRLARPMAEEPGRLRVVCVALNSSPETLTFRLPGPEGERRLLIDSAHPEREEQPVGDAYEIEAHGAALIAWEADLP
jgi:isoamylase